MRPRRRPWPRPPPQSASRTQDFVDQARKQGVKIAKAQKQAGQAGATGSAPNPLDNPFGGLGGAGSDPLVRHVRRPTAAR